MDRGDIERRRAKIGAALCAATLIGLAVVANARAATPSPDAARVATLMSWYDDVGLPVACGRGRMPAGVHGAAHRTLPCGTRIGVCLPDLSRCVEARIVDRGPYVAGRDLDLFGRTFAALAPLSVGVLPVVYRVHTVPRCVPAWVKTYRRAGNTVGRYAPTCGTAAAR